MVGMVFEALSAGAFTALMEPIIDDTFVARREGTGWLPLAIIGLFAIRGIATFVTDFGMASAGRSVVRDLRTSLLEKFLGLPGARFDREPTPMMVSRLNYDTDQVAQATSEAIKVIITDTLMITVQLGVMFYNSVKVSLVLLVIGPIIALISAYVSRRYRGLSRSIQEGVGKLAHAAEESLAAQQEVKVYGTQQTEAVRYKVLADTNLRLSMKVEATRAGASAIVQ